MSNEALAETVEASREITAESRIQAVIVLIGMSLIPLLIGLALLRKERSKSPSDKLLES
jgi:hypothetical protein